ncbi:MAG: sulfatase-like hydrolase/transferase [Planctomycetota bacterium]
MQRTTLPLLLAGLTALLGCGGDAVDSPEPGWTAPPAWGLPGGRSTAESAAPDVERCDLVFVALVDGATRSELAAWGGDARSTPHLDALAAGGTIFDRAVAVHTSGNAGIASVLTGRHSREHGVASLRDLGRSTLSPEERTLAEAFKDLGWTTCASLSDPRHARGFSGFAQGFDQYEAPRVGEATWPADSVAIGALQALRTKLQPGQPLFLFASFGDLTDRRAPLPPADVAAPFIEARLRPFAERRAELAVQLDRLAEGGGDAALNEIKNLLSRARGSSAAGAWVAALRDARLAGVDAAIGTLLSAIEAAGRAETATVIVAAPRGWAPAAAQVRAGAQFAPTVVDVPLVVRWPFGARAGRDASVTSVLDATRALDEAFGLDLAPTSFSARSLLAPTAAGAVAFVVDGRFDRFAAVADGIQVERWGLEPDLHAFARGAGEGADAALDLLEAGADPWGGDAARAARFDAFVAPPTATLLRGPGAPALSVTWRTSDGRVQRRADAAAAGDGTPLRMVGSARLQAPMGETLTLELERRATSILVDLHAGDQPLGPGDVSFGGTRLAELPVLFVPAADSEPVPPDEVAMLRLRRAEGIWWTLSVAGEGPVQVLVGTWPVRSPEDALEVVAGGPVQQRDVPGRGDLVHLVGTAPFDLRIKRAGNEEFAIACLHGDRFLRPTEMVTDDLRYATDSAFAVLVPSWQASTSDALRDTTAALYGNEPGDAAIAIHRTSLGSVRDVSAALDEFALDFLRSLPAGE